MYRLAIIQVTSMLSTNTHTHTAFPNNFFVVVLRFCCVFCYVSKRNPNWMRALNSGKLLTFVQDEWMRWKRGRAKSQQASLSQIYFEIKINFQIYGDLWPYIKFWIIHVHVRYFYSIANEWNQPASCSEQTNFRNAFHVSQFVDSFKFSGLWLRSMCVH